MREVTGRKAFLDLVSLGACLIGFVGLIYVVWKLKTGSGEIPRPVFLGCLALVCSPLYLALVRQPKLPFVVPPLIAIFLLYPIASPHGVVYTSDPIFNFDFANSVLATGFWMPGQGEAFAGTYSFYPVGNVFIGYVIAAGQLPPAQSYMWIEPMIRLAAVPAMVYAIGQRLFGTRAAALGLLLYVGTASILFNVPVQQGIGVIFFGLSLLALILLTQEPSWASRHRIELLFVLMSAAIVMTHHLSSYIFAGWLAALVVLAIRRRNWPSMVSPRLTLLFLYFIALLSLYVALFTYRIFLTQQLTLQGVLNGIVAPEQSPSAPPSPTLGRTFSTLEIVWLGGSVLALVFLALLTVLRYRVTRQSPFAVANGLVASMLTLVTLPLIATPLNYIPLRIGEYANLVVAPLAAVTLLRIMNRGAVSSIRWLPGFFRRRKWLTPVSALLVCALLLMGGNLAPISMRTYYESPESRATDTPLNLGVEGLRAADWATGHFGRARVWGDQLGIDVFAGFSDMLVDYGSRRLFENATMNASAWAILSAGDYIVVDRWMLTLHPNWLHEPLSPAPLTPEQAYKFASDPHFALVYQDDSYSVFRVISVPRAGSP